jgi:D-alanyl-D-alanine carboxypeptidase
MMTGYLTPWRVTAAALACLTTAVMVSFPKLGPSSETGGAPMEVAPGLTPARVQLDRLLAAFNTGDRDAIDRYRRDEISPHWTHAPTTDMALNWFKQTGGYRPLWIHDVAPNYLEALVRNADSDDLFFMGIQVELGQPHRLIYLTLRYASNVPGHYWPQPLNNQAVIEELRAQLEQRVPAQKFSGAVLVKQRDDILLREAFGFADARTRAPNSVATRFRIGQLSNMFTAVALVRLMQEGRLSDQDAVGRWLPELMDEPAGRITLGQLLANSGATDDIEHLGWDSDRERRRSLAELVEEFGDAELIGRPGKQFRYSSLGYVLLAAVVERASGAPYSLYINDVVLRPAGMTATDFSTDAQSAGRARPYRRPPGAAQWELLHELQCCPGAPVAEAYSTVDDIARFLEALDQRRLLDDAHTRLLLEPRIPMWGRAHHAYGLTTEIYADGSPWITYEDGIEGQNSAFMYRPETGHLVIVLGNFDAPTARQLVRFVGARFPMVPRPVEMNLQAQ